MRCSDVKATAAQCVSRCGRSNRGGKQTRGFEHYGITAASKSLPGWNCYSLGIAKRRPAPKIGKAVVLREETGKCTAGAAGVGVQTRGERYAEITPGRSNFQQGFATTCKDPRYKGKTRD